MVNHQAKDPNGEPSLDTDELGARRGRRPPRGRRAPTPPVDGVLSLHENSVAAIATTDVGAHRERSVGQTSSDARQP